MRTPLKLVALLILAQSAAAQQPNYEEGPLTGSLGMIAEIEVPSGYGFVDARGMPAFNQATGNLHSPDDVGALIPLDEESTWVAFFAFDQIGYVKDDDRDLDADALMKSFKENSVAANEERRKRGIPELTTVGWSTPPFYDTTTNNLTWGTRLRSGQDEIINHNIRLLGRRGVMRVVVVDAPDLIEGSVAEFTEVLEGYQFKDGHKYSQFTSGDKVAKYGLAGLMLGGGAALLATKGGKFLKPLILAVVAAFAFVGNWIKGLFGGGKKEA